VVIADTAGRLPTQLHLMEEAKKIKRVIAKAEAGAPHEVWLVLDANTGQNSLSQLRAFDEALGLTGLILTKLDGTAKGGAVCAIARQRPLPLRFIGVGEGAEDLRPFVAGEFVRRFSIDHGDHLVPPGQQALSGGIRGAQGGQLHRRAGRDDVPHRPFRCGQDDASQADRAIERANGGAVLVNGQNVSALRRRRFPTCGAIWAWCSRGRGCSSTGAHSTTSCCRWS